MLSEFTESITTGKLRLRHAPFFELPLQHERELMTTGNILLMEADPALRNTRQRLLVKEGYHVTVVSNLEGAVRTANRESFELLVITVENPLLISMIVAQFPPSMGILVLSDRANAEMVIENLEGGVVSFLFSPFTAKKTRKAVSRTLARARLVRDSIRNEVLNDLGALNHELTTEPGIDKFMDTIVRIGAVSTRSDYVSMVAFANGTTEPFIRSEAGLYNSDWDIIFNRMGEITDPVIINPYSQYYSGLIDLMEISGVSSVLHVPIVIKGTTLGAVTCIRKQENGMFAESDLSFMSILAWWTSMAIENTRVYLDYYKEHLHADRLLDRISFAQENERKRVAIEIHDGVAQWLVGASYDVKMCSRLISESNYSELEGTLDKVKNVLQNSIKELRRAIENLPLPPIEEMGLTGSIQRMIQKMEEEGIHCTIEIPDELPALTVAQEKTFYWLIQESLTNVRKHARASNVHIRIEYSGNTLSITIKDDGIGFDISRLMSSDLAVEHIGLFGMKERAEYLNGTIDIDSKPGQGTAIFLIFSLVPPEIYTIART